MTNAIEMAKLYFEEGLPGFPHLQFFQLEQQGSDSPFFILKSVEDSLVEFGVINPFVFVQDYEFTLSEQIKEEIRIKEGTSIIVLNIITLHPDGNVTANMKAPVVINLDNRMAKQVILTEENFQIRQPLLQIRPKAVSE